MLPGRQAHHGYFMPVGTHERNPIPLCSAVISSYDASTQEQRKAYFAEQKLNLMEGAQQDE